MSGVTLILGGADAERSRGFVSDKAVCLDSSGGRSVRFDTSRSRSVPVALLPFSIGEVALQENSPIPILYLDAFDIDHRPE